MIPAKAGFVTTITSIIPSDRGSANASERNVQKSDEESIGMLQGDLGSAGCKVTKLLDGGDATRRWNGALDPHPILIAQCSTTEQVSAALVATRRAGQSIAVHNGGQDWVGRSLRDGSVVLDLSAMTSIEIDAEGQEAVIGGGVTARLLNEAAGERGLAAVIGTDGAIGMPGLFLGGGYGPLMTRFGLACDNLLSAEIVLLDGRVVRCDAEQEPDLFWALRGGGGNFGIVTSARLRLHDVTALVGTFVFAWTEARIIMEAYAELMTRAPAELFGVAVLVLGHGGSPIVVVSLVWTGEPEKGNAVMSEFAAAGSPIMTKTEDMSGNALLALNDGKLVQGRGYDVGTRWFSTLSLDAIDKLIAGFDERTSPLSSIIVHHCHGAATQVPATATAFGMRQPHFTALIYSAWEPASSDGAQHREWTVRLMASLASMSLPGGYANLLTDTRSVQIAHAYGPNASRLAQLKQRYDPEGVFQAIPLPTKAAR
jgi:FAD/FMN-containing dehydrogenase